MLNNLNATCTAAVSHADIPRSMEHISIGSKVGGHLALFCNSSRELGELSRKDCPDIIICPIAIALQWDRL